MGDDEYPARQVINAERTPAFDRHRSGAAEVEGGRDSSFSDGRCSDSNDGESSHHKETTRAVYEDEVDDSDDDGCGCFDGIWSCGGGADDDNEAGCCDELWSCGGDEEKGSGRCDGLWNCCGADGNGSRDGEEGRSWCIIM